MQMQILTEVSCLSFSAQQGYDQSVLSHQCGVIGLRHDQRSRSTISLASSKESPCSVGHRGCLPADHRPLAREEQNSNAIVRCLCLLRASYGRTSRRTPHTGTTVGVCVRWYSPGASAAARRGMRWTRTCLCPKGLSVQNSRC